MQSILSNIQVRRPFRIAHAGLRALAIGTAVAVCASLAGCAANSQSAANDPSWASVGNNGGKVDRAVLARTAAMKSSTDVGLASAANPSGQ